MFLAGGGGSGSEAQTHPPTFWACRRPMAMAPKKQIFLPAGQLAGPAASQPASWQTLSAAQSNLYVLFYGTAAQCHAYSNRRPQFSPAALRAALYMAVNTFKNFGGAVRRLIYSAKYPKNLKNPGGALRRPIYSSEYPDKNRRRFAPPCWGLCPCWSLAPGRPPCCCPMPSQSPKSQK